MAMNTPYLGSSASVPANLNTSYISTGLTEITSALSLWGPVTFLQGSPTFSSGISASTGTFSSNVTIGGGLTVSGVTTIIGGGAPIVKVDSILTSMAAIGVANQGMTEVQVAFAGSGLTDTVMIGNPSVLSTGLIATSYVSSAGTVVLRVLNVSTSTATEAAKVWRFTRIGF